MKVALSIAFPLGFAIGAGFVFLIGGGGLFRVAAQLFLPWIAALTAVVFVVWSATYSRNKMGGYFILSPLLVVTGAGLAVWTLSNWLVELRTEKVKQYVEAAIPVIEQYKLDNGYYPNSLTDLDFGPIPYYLRSGSAFTSSTNDWTFYYETPDSWMGGMLYSKSQPSWGVAD